jgi:NAD(P)-dependent dehydrogenase (short-subunit alcohol dehydrogenase family)
MTQEWRIETWPTEPAQLFRLDGKVALVTGAASGLGRAIALGLDAVGAQVLAADINLSGAEEVAGALRKESGALHVDVTDEESVRVMVASALERYGRIDVCFNIPGTNVRKPLTELTLAEWRRVSGLNMEGMFLCARELGRVMLRQQQGSMVNLASARGLLGGANQSVYSVSKAGAAQLTRCLALEWAPWVRVNALAPGYMTTPLVEAAMQDAEWQAGMQALHPLGRFGRPDEIVGPAIFLASEASSFVTGAVLSVDGGWTAGK